MKDDNIIEYNLNRRQFVGVAGVLAGTALAGCSGKSNDGENGGGDGNGGGGGGGNNGKKTRLNVAISAEVWNFDPALWTDTATSTVGGLIFDEVIELTPDEKLKPGLVTEVPEPKNGGKAFEYTLRDGITFHNGDDVTVEDFKYSVDWILNPDNNSPIKSRMPFVESSEIVGDRTLRLNTSKPFGTLNWWLTRSLEGIVPKDSRGETQDGKGPSGLATKLTNDPSGAGTGPYEFVEWKSGSHVLLKKNENYWMDGIPSVDEIKFDFIGENSTRLANLRSGTIDLTNKVPPKDFEGLKGQPDITAESVPGNLAQVLYVNLMEAEGNPMSNVHNRRAVLYGIDGDEILDEIFQGQGVVQKGPWYPDSEWTSPKLKEMKLYDPDESTLGTRKGGQSRRLRDGHHRHQGLVVQGRSHRHPEPVVQHRHRRERHRRGQVDAAEPGLQHEQVARRHGRLGAVDSGRDVLAGGGLREQQPQPQQLASPGGRPDGHLRPERTRTASGRRRGTTRTDTSGTSHSLREAQAATDKKTQKEIVYRLQEYLVEHAIQIDIAYVNSLEAWSNSVKNYEIGTFVDKYRDIEVGE